MSTTAEDIRARLAARAREEALRRAQDALQLGLQNLDFAIYRQLQVRTTVPALEGRVDGFPVEEHGAAVGLTQNPVESGSTIVDNAVKRPDRLRLTGRVSDILPAPGRLLNPDGPADLWQEVLSLMANRVLLEVLTPLRTYRDMLIVDARTVRDRQSGFGLRFVIDFREVLYTETSLARFPPDVVDLLGPAADRTSETDGGDRSSPVVAGLKIPTRLSEFRRNLGI